MRSYASISPMFWTRGSGKRLRGDVSAQLVALYLMSSPGTSMIGIFHLALPTLCHETGLSIEDAIKGLQRCAEEHIAYWDEPEELVFVPALAKHQLGEELKERDHKVKGVLRALAPFKGHRFYEMFLERYADSYWLSEEESDAPSEGLPRDDVPVLSCPDPVSGISERVDPDPPSPERVVFDAWRVETNHLKAKFDANRRKRIKARFRDGFTPEQLVQAIKNRRNDPFLMGENDTGQVYDDLESLLRTAGKVEKLLALTEPLRARGGGGRQQQHRQPDSGYSPSDHAREGK